MASDDQDRPPWKRRNPRKTAGKPSKHLTAAEKQQARSRARAAGRRYPNLVDNMAVAAKKKPVRKKAAAKGGAARKKAAPKKTSSGKTSGRKTSSGKTARTATGRPRKTRKQAKSKS